MTDWTSLSKTYTILPKIRRIVQIIMLGVLGKWAFYGIFRCPYLIPFVNCANCPVITCWGRIPAYSMGIWTLLPLSAFLFGRAFCGWLCPTGYINQLLGTLARFKLPLRGWHLRLGQAGMILSLTAALIIYIGFDNPRVMVPIHIGDFWNSIYLSVEHASWIWLFRTGIVLSLIGASVCIANLWCRFICPMGGLLETIKRVSLFGFTKTKSCNDCDTCLRKCEMSTRPDEANCTNCGACLSVCPQKAIRFGRRQRHD